MLDTATSRISTNSQGIIRFTCRYCCYFCSYVHIYGILFDAKLLVVKRNNSQAICRFIVRMLVNLKINANTSTEVKTSRQFTSNLQLFVQLFMNLMQFQLSSSQTSAQAILQQESLFISVQPIHLIKNNTALTARIQIALVVVFILTRYWFKPIIR